MNWANRIVRHAEVDPKVLLPHPDNWKDHTGLQRKAMATTLGKIGLIQSVIVNERTGRIIDGHLRVELALSSGAPIPVCYVDLDEAEEIEALRSFDLLGWMAATKDQTLEEFTQTGKALMEVSSPSKPRLANVSAVLKMAVHVEDVRTVERALGATGERDRGKALMRLAEHFLVSDKDAKRQLNLRAKDETSLAAFVRS